jgi:hypothetical protein
MASAREALISEPESPTESVIENQRVKLDTATGLVDPDPKPVH